MITLDTGLSELLGAQSHRFASLMKITRKDGTILRFTDHNERLDFESFTYTPVGGFDQTARKKEADLRERNHEFFGALVSSAFTFDDLRARRYNNAKVEIDTIDWRYPWMGSFHKDVLYVASTKFDGEKWSADLTGLTRRLTRSYGDVLSRMCRWDLGEGFGTADEPGCRVDRDSFSYFSQAVTAVSVNTSVFTLGNLPTTLGDDYFNFGEIVWLNGPNKGLSFKVLDFDGTTLEVTLQLPTPFAITTSHVCNAYAGCDQTWTTCGGRFSNTINYGGYRDHPGTDRLMENAATT